MVQTIYLNLSSMKQRVLREYQVYTLFFQGWVGEGNLEFLEFDGRNIIHVNPSSNESVVVGTATPRP